MTRIPRKIHRMEVEHRETMAKRRKEDQEIVVRTKLQDDLKLETHTLRTMFKWEKLRSGTNTQDIDLVKLMSSSILLDDKNKKIAQKFMFDDDDVFQLAKALPRMDHRLLSNILTRRSVFRNIKRSHNCCSGLLFDLVIEMEETPLGLCKMKLAKKKSIDQKSFSCYEWYMRFVDEVVWNQSNLEHLLNGISFFGNAVDILGCGSLKAYFFQCPVSWELYTQICSKLQDVKKNVKKFTDAKDPDYYKCGQALMSTDSRSITRTCSDWGYSLHPTTLPDPMPGMSFEVFCKTIPVTFRTFQDISNRAANYQDLAIQDYNKHQMETAMKSRRDYRSLDGYDPSLEFNHAQPAIMYDMNDYDEVVKLPEPRSTFCFFEQHMSLRLEAFSCHRWYALGTEKFVGTPENLEKLQMGIAFVGNMLDIVGCGSRKAYFFEVPVTFANYRAIMRKCEMLPNQKRAGDTTI